MFIIKSTMAILNKKEEKIQAVLGRMPENYTQDDFVRGFIQYFSNDWGKIKRAYNKQNQDKEAGTVVNMPKPEDYIKQLLEIELKKQAPVTPAVKKPAKTKSLKTAEVTEKIAPTKAKNSAKATATTATKDAKKAAASSAKPKAVKIKKSTG